MILAAALILMGAEAVTSPLASGNTFLAECEKSKVHTKDNLIFGVCTGYLRGIVDRDLVSEERQICMPKSVTNGQLLDVALEFLRHNPERRQLSAGLLTSFALSQNFPCLTKDKR
ncbi:MAG: hypothetical protein JSR96_14605 [Proteobacteria bacterium]|nr:hypothetical protein [Pseudomonadota bacterium]